jgi:hypothetical protein
MTTDSTPTEHRKTGTRSDCRSEKLKVQAIGMKTISTSCCACKNVSERVPL